jgi:hypothetical protein
MSSPDSRRPTTSRLDAAADLLGRAGRLGRIPVVGDSMRPTLMAGLAILVDFRPDRTQVGDLVLFRQGGALVVHRLLARVRSRRAGPCLRTRGDGRPDLDPPVLAPSVLGRVVAVERPDGTWRSLEGPTARVYAALLAAHDHTWAALWTLAGRADRAFRRTGLATDLKGAVARADRAVLAIVDRALFRAAHRARRAPAGAGDVADPLL